MSVHVPRFALRRAFCRWIGGLALLFALGTGSTHAATYPWPNGERLSMEIFWPSGVSMGDATLEAKSIKDDLYFSASVEVALPQGRILYKYSSIASGDLCSKEFRQSAQRPGKFWEETTKFDPEAGKASITRDGRTRELAAAKCSRDPLTYLYHHRAQLAAGKKPTAETLFLAGPLTLRIDAAAKERVKINRVERQGARFKVTYPLATGEGVVEVWFSDAPAYTPIAVRLPLPLATFSAELRGQ